MNTSTLIISKEAPRSTVGIKDTLWRFGIVLSVLIIIVWVASFVMLYMFTQYEDYLLASEKRYILSVSFIPLLSALFTAWYILWHTNKIVNLRKDIFMYGVPIEGRVEGYYTGMDFLLTAPSAHSWMKQPLSFFFISNWNKYVVIEITNDDGKTLYHTIVASRLSGDPDALKQLKVGDTIKGLSYQNQYLFPYDTSPHFLIEG